MVFIQIQGSDSVVIAEIFAVIGFIVTILLWVFQGSLQRNIKNIDADVSDAKDKYEELKAIMDRMQSNLDTFKEKVESDKFSTHGIIHELTQRMSNDLHQLAISLAEIKSNVNRSDK